jgi:hypothetical protein
VNTPVTYKQQSRAGKVGCAGIRSDCDRGRALAWTRLDEELGHAVQSNAVAFGVLEDRNETMLADGRARLDDRTSGAGDAF